MKKEKNEFGLSMYINSIITAPVRAYPKGIIILEGNLSTISPTKYTQIKFTISQLKLI